MGVTVTGLDSARRVGGGTTQSAVLDHSTNREQQQKHRQAPKINRWTAPHATRIYSGYIFTIYAI